MQVYKDLSILTARPTPDEERLAPHRLFGAIDGAVNFSAGRWARAAGVTLPGSATISPSFSWAARGFISALSPMACRICLRSPKRCASPLRSEAEGRATAELHAELAARDRETAARLNASDRQRILRALEVLAATGRPARLVPRRAHAPALKQGEWKGLYLAPDRAELNQRIDARFDAMLARGALDEVAALMRRRLDPALPIMRAHGVPHLIARLEGRLNLEEAAARSKLDTRHYAKRQFTWARHQLTGFRWVAPEEALEAGLRAFD